MTVMKNTKSVGASQNQTDQPVLDPRSWAGEGLASRWKIGDNCRMKNWQDQEKSVNGGNQEELKERWDGRYGCVL